LQPYLSSLATDHVENFPTYYSFVRRIEEDYILNGQFIPEFEHLISVRVFESHDYLLAFLFLAQIAKRSRI
jgi:hypothetical protein